MSNHTDEIFLVDYRPQWPALFEQEATILKETLNKQNIVAIEHFGSTAIPGLRAKPIIDIMVLVKSLAEAKKDIPGLEALGYAYWADNPQKDRLFLVKGLPPNGPRTHHIHIAETETGFHERLLFRDYLKSHPAVAQEYADLKATLAAQYKEDREAYTAAKTDFVTKVMEKARKELHAGDRLL
jgi:GrpB-like predicted nucleotidyltransferase (UPF0157 family)